MNSLQTPAIALVWASWSWKTTLIEKFSQEDIIDAIKKSWIPIRALLQDTAFTQRDREIYEQQLGAVLTQAYRNCFGCSGKTWLFDFVRRALADAREYTQTQNESYGVSPSTFLEHLKDISWLIVMETYSEKKDVFANIRSALQDWNVHPSQQSLIAVLSMDNNIRNQLAFLEATRWQYTEIITTHSNNQNTQNTLQELTEILQVPIFDWLHTTFILPNDEYFNRLSNTYPQHPKLHQQPTITLSTEHGKDRIRSASHNYFRLWLSGQQYADAVNDLVENASNIDRYYVPVPLRQDVLESLQWSSLPLCIQYCLKTQPWQFLIIEKSDALSTIKYWFAPTADRAKIRFWNNKSLKDTFNENYMDWAEPTHSRDLFARRECNSDDEILDHFENLLDTFDNIVKQWPYEFNNETCVMLGEIRAYIEEHRTTLYLDSNIQKKIEQAKKLTLEYMQRIFEDKIAELQQNEKAYNSVDELWNDLELIITMVWYRTARENIVSKKQQRFLKDSNVWWIAISLWKKLIQLIDQWPQTDNPYLQQPTTLDLHDAQYNPESLLMIFESEYNEIDEKQQEWFIKNIINKFTEWEWKNMTFADSHKKRRKSIVKN